MSTRRSIQTLATLAAVGLATLAGPARAAAIEYLFFATNPFEQRNNAPAPLDQRLATPGDSVFGTLTYDPAGAFIGSSPVIGMADVYAAVTNFGGVWARETGLKVFADASGGVIVNNDNFPQPGPAPSLGDAVLAVADPLILPPNLGGFTVSDGITEFTLRNFSLNWLELFGQDFLSDQSLPPGLPPPGAGPARLTLDFVATGDEMTTHRIIFTQVVLTPVPIPAGGLLLVGALGALAGFRRRAHRTAVAG